MSKINLFKKLNCIKFPKILLINNCFYIIGILPIINNDLTTFDIVLYKSLDEKFENYIFLKKFNFNKSIMVRSTYMIDKKTYLIVEEKINNGLLLNKSYICELFIDDIVDNINLKFVEKIDIKENVLIHNYNLGLMSKLVIDEERPDYFWGKYLFYFQNENKEFYKPIFDNIVNYDKDKGHILHYIEEIKKNINEHEWDFDNDGNCVYKKYFIIFSIRHKYEDEPTKYYYKIYSAYSDDLKYFYDTKEIQIEDNISESKWYCYPEIFKKDNKYHVLLCQDDFGKEKETLLGELIIS